MQKVNGIEDWEKVVVTYNEDDVKGLTRVGLITKTSAWGGSLATGLGNTKALRKLQKEAAKLKASIILIADKPNEQTTKYGAGVKLTAIAYR